MSEFRNGERVCIDDRDESRHHRVPAYAKGHCGEVVRVCHEQCRPEDLAGGQLNGAKVAVYRVRLRQVDLWPHYICSCYPRMLLGRPPLGYKSGEYRSRVVKEPRAVLREFGTVVDDDVQLRVHDSTADLRYLVLPRRPAGSESMTEDELAALVTRDAMIGVCEVTV